MILSDFRQLVFDMGSRFGKPSINSSDTVTFNSMLNEMLNVYASKTGCLYSEAVAFTPVIGLADYSTFDPSTFAAGSTGSPQPVTYLAQPMVGVEQCYLNGAPLLVCGSSSPSPYTNPRWAVGIGRYGPSSEVDVIWSNPSYLTQPNGLPNYFFQKAPNLIRFDKAFDQVYSNCYFSGRLYHTPLTLANGGDNQNLDLSVEDLEPAAMLCRNRLLRPFNPDLVAIGTPLKTEVDQAMKIRMGDCESKSAGIAFRGYPGSEGYIDLSV